MQRGVMLRVWSVCATQRDRGRTGERDGGGKWLLLCSQTVSKPTLAALSSDGAWQTLKIYSCFPKSSSCSFREKNFFSLRAYDESEVSLSASNFAWTSFVFSKASGSWEQRRNSFSDFRVKISGSSLFRLWHCASLVKSFWGCEWGVIMASVVCRVAVWISDPLLQTSKRQRGNERASVWFLWFAVCRMIRKAVELTITLLFATLHFFQDAYPSVTPVVH